MTSSRPTGDGTGGGGGSAAVVPDPGPGRVVELGLVADAFATVQIDLNVVQRAGDGRASEITLCDHNCVVAVDGVPTGGHYSCPAALSLNRGARHATPTPADKLTTGLHATIDGIKRAQDRFLAEDLDGYLVREGIPEGWRGEFGAALARQRVIVNLFGGSPETHPDALEIIADLHDHGALVHLTTTGRKILRDDRFRTDFLSRPPDLLGLGADDFLSVDDMDRLFALSYEQLNDLWRATPWQHGQRRKTIETVQLCKLAARVPMPPILFNIVLHSANLDQAELMLDTLSRYAGSEVILNPYPVQTAFLGSPGALDAAGLDRLRAVVREAITAHLDRAAGRRPRWNLARRLGYWLLLQSVLEQDGDPRAISDQVGGDGVWRCYTGRGAGRCVQVGMGGEDVPASPYAGGHLGCFWNSSTVTDERQIWTLGAGEIADWILDGRQQAAARAADPCRGCLFPRMSTDAVSLELGLTPPALARYRSVRARYLGY